jgi:hypothetical protein
VDEAPDRGLSVTVTSRLLVDRPAAGNGAGAGLIGLRERPRWLAGTSTRP